MDPGSTERRMHMQARSLFMGVVVLAGCSSSSGGSGGGARPSDSGAQPPALNPDTAPVVAVDRFSDGFAHLFARSKNPSLPAANAPIDFDQEGPFITHGLG